MEFVILIAQIMAQHARMFSEKIDINLRRKEEIISRRPLTLTLGNPKREKKSFTQPRANYWHKLDSVSNRIR